MKQTEVDCEKCFLYRKGGRSACSAPKHKEERERWEHDVKVADAILTRAYTKDCPLATRILGDVVRLTESNDNSKS